MGMGIRSYGVEQAISERIIERTRRFAPGLPVTGDVSAGFEVIADETDAGYWLLSTKAQIATKANMALSERAGYACVKDAADIGIRVWPGTQTVEVVCPYDDTFDRRIILVDEKQVFDPSSATVVFRPLVERCGGKENELIRLSIQFEVEPADLIDAWRGGGDTDVCIALWRMLEARSVEDGKFLTAADMYDGLLGEECAKSDVVTLLREVAFA